MKNTRMKPQELADKLGVTKATVYYWISRGCPWYKGVRSKYLLDLEEVKKWRKEWKRWERRVN